MANEGVSRSHGLTRTERRLTVLAERSFLDLWCYSNVHADDGVGKEVCDLLVIFDHDIVIFSDKEVSLPQNPDEIQWKRWHRRAIERSAQQLQGAKRWLLNNPNRVFLDKHCRVPLPVEIPQGPDVRFHLVTVTAGAEEECKARYPGPFRTFSLRLGSELVSEKNCVVGARQGSDFVHVLTQDSLALLLEEFDTISDFVAYLSAKKSLAMDGKIGACAGEHELVAFFRATDGFRSAPVFDIDVIEAPPGVINLSAGAWGRFVQSGLRLDRQEADKPSYLWDKLIAAFTSNILAGRTITRETLSIAEQERGIREMARESRFSRRQLSTAILGVRNAVAPNASTQHARTVLSPEEPNRAYIFFQFPFIAQRYQDGYDSYRLERIHRLYARVLDCRRQYKINGYVIGIGTEPLSQRSKGATEDLVVLDGRVWSEEMANEAMRLRAILDEDPGAVSGSFAAVFDLYPSFGRIR